MSGAAPASRRPAALALVLNAFIWGTSWWPFRQLEVRGLHPLWATAVVFALSCAVIAVARPKAAGQLRRHPALWVLVLAAGTTNAAFNWGVVVGDVVRVVLLFYLMPVWSVLLARLLLGERLTRGAALRIGLALAGAAVVLWPQAGTGDGLAFRLPDLLGLAGGLSFALNNVMLRRLTHLPQEGRAFAMFLGGVLVAGMLALGLARQGLAPWPPAPDGGWLPLALLLAALFLVSNLALQYGASRLPVHVTAVVMLTEIVFAAGSAWALGAGVLTPRLVLGGALILAAAVLAARSPHA